MIHLWNIMLFHKWLMRQLVNKIVIFIIFSYSIQRATVLSHKMGITIIVGSVIFPITAATLVCMESLMGDSLSPFSMVTSYSSSTSSDSLGTAAVCNPHTLEYETEILTNFFSISCPFQLIFLYHWIILVVYFIST